MTQDMSRYHHLIKTHPEDPAVFNSRGLVYYAQKKYAEALSDFNQALTLKADYVEALNNRSLIFFYQENYSDALQDLELALKLAPQNAESYNNRGLVYDALGKTELAQADFLKATDLNISFSGGFDNLGLATAKQGDADSLIHEELAANLLTRRTF